MSKTRGIENRVIALSLIDAHPRNYNKHSAAQLADLAASLEQFGQVRSIVVQQAGKRFIAVAGHGIAEAARSKGWTEIRADVIPSGWSQTRVLAYLAADNELARRGDPDQDQLAAIVKEVLDAEGEALARLAAGEQSALDALLVRASPKEETVDAGALVDKAAELQKKWKVTRGDVWQIGKHRLMCGDSTSAEDVATLMGGEKAQLVFTDPPYNVKFMSRKNKTHALDYTTAPYEDDRSPEEWMSFVGAMFVNIDLYLEDGGCFYVWGGQRAIVDYYNWCPDSLLIHQNIIWDKQWAFLNRRDYLSAYESCVYGWKLGKAHYFHRQPDHENYSDIWAVKKINPNEMEHSAQKPTDLAKRAMNTSSQAGWIVLDFFNGSGSTLAACEEAGRVGRAMELLEKYCAVTLERLSLLGLTPQRIENVTDGKQKASKTAAKLSANREKRGPTRQKSQQSRQSATV